MASTVTTWTLGGGQEWPGLDTRTSPDATGGALVATGCRRDEGRLRAIEAPSALPSVGASTLRGQAFHVKGGGGRVHLVVSGATLYADGVAQKQYDGSTFSIAGSGAVIFDQGGNRTLIVTGGASDAAYLYDETLTAPNSVFPVALPTTPTGITPASVDIASALVLSLEGTQGANVSAGTGWSVQGSVGGGHWDQVNYDNAAFGVPVVHLNTDVGLAVGDGVFYTFPTEKDLSDVTTFYLDAVSGGNENRAGTFLALVVGRGSSVPTATDTTETLIPFAFKSAGTINHITIVLANTPSSDLKHIKYVGVRVINADDQFVVWLHNLTTGKGTVGPREYLRTRNRTVGTLDVQSQEGPRDGNDSPAPVTFDAGTKGVSVHLAFADTVPAGTEDHIWRRDTTLSDSFKYVGKAAAGATYFDDAVADVSSNHTLRPGRSAPPVGATCGAFLQNRLVLFKGGSLYISSGGNPTAYVPYGPQDVDQLTALGQMDDADGLVLSVGEIGQVLGMAKFGFDVADRYDSGLLLMSLNGIDALLEGDSPKTFRAKRQQPGGICGPLAWCHDRGGSVVKVDANGDLYAVNRLFQQEILTRDPQTGRGVQEELRNAIRGGGGLGWVLVYEGAYSRVTLFAHRPLVLDADRQWTSLDPATTGAVTCAATKPGGDGGHAIIGGPDGALMQLYDPAAPRNPFQYGTSDWNKIPTEWRADRLWADVEGVVTDVLTADGATVATLTSGRGQVPVRRHSARRFRHLLTGAGTAVVHRLQTRLVNTQN